MNTEAQRPRRPAPKARTSPGVRAAVEAQVPAEIRTEKPAPPPARTPSQARYRVRPQPMALVSLDPLRTHFLERAQVVDATLAPQGPRDRRTLAARRGYSREDLQAVAEIGYHYLHNGGVRFARLLFEGLVAVSPDEPYFALALGLAADHAGDKGMARREYQRASDLDPSDPRPEVNLAELDLEAGRFDAARRHLVTASDRLALRLDPALALKTRALLHRTTQLCTGAPR
ncbi:MAG: hypothetical protein IPG45_15160 [Deltaproteobacteria bacterium]|nr:hypothetical protein [Deltaproteobacteria bacterium]